MNRKAKGDMILEADTYKCIVYLLSSINLPSPLFAKEGQFPPFGKGRIGGI